MKKLLFLISLWLCVTTAGAQQNERDLYSVAFYNLENLFDTIHDAVMHGRLRSMRPS